MRTVRSGGWGRTALVIATLVPALFIGLSSSIAQFSGRRPGPRFTPDTSHTADALLRNAAAHVRDRQWTEAIEIYQKVISQFADKVAELSKDDPAGDPTGEMPLAIDLRLYCQRKIAALPPEGLAIYRARVDSQAERWFREGELNRDRASLQKVVDQAYCSTWGDNAIELLGDLAFQDGRFSEALSYYRQLVSEGAQPDRGRLYPDPDVELAIIAAKAILSRTAAGENGTGEADLRTFAAVFPNAKGELAGRKGDLVTILSQAIREDQLSPSSHFDARWPTFAGAPTRSRIVAGPIDVGSFQWQVKLKPAYTYRPNNIYGGGMGGGRFNNGYSNTPRPTEERLLAYHPIIMGDQVIVGAEDRVIAYNLNDRPLSTLNTTSDTVPEVWEHRDPLSYPPNASRGIAIVPRFTLTAFGDRIYARMGQTGGSSSARMAPTQSFVVALDRSTMGKELWKKPAIEIPLPRKGGEAARRAASFEGSPLADARNVYIGLTESEALTQMYVACLDAEKGTPRWVRYLGAGASVDAAQVAGGGGMGGITSPDVGTRLLTLDGPTLYYQTNMGAVTSLDAETGTIRWVATYPRVERNSFGSGPQRDLNPAIVHDGLVIVAPDDANAIFAFDANSGKLAWRSDPIPDEVKLTHVLGVAQGKLIATGDRVLWFDVKTGKLTRAWPDGGRPFEGFGRGLLAGDRVYWPTRGEIHILDQATGLRTDPPIKLQETFGTTGGNLVAGDGYLIVAQAEAMVVFCQNSRLIQRYRDDIARAPEQPANYYRLARAAEATGQDDLALQSFAETASRSKPSDLLDGASLLDATRDHQHRLLMKLARQDRKIKEYQGAVDRFTQAAEVARSSKDRVAARLELADAFVAFGNVQAGVDCLQALLAEEPLRSVGVLAGDGQRTVRADLLIAGRLEGLTVGKGAEFYAKYDQKASALLNQGLREKSVRLLEDVAHGYPVARAVPQAWLALAKLHLERNQPAESARAYKRLFAASATPEDQGRALLGMARAYESQRLWSLAREAYGRLANRYTKVMVDQQDVAALAKLRLASAPFDRLASDHDDLTLSLPLSRLWNVRWAGGTRVMSAEGVPPSTESGRMFLVQGGTIRPVNPLTGQVGWTADLGGEPIWIGYLADRVLAATANRIVGLSLTQGNLDWDHRLGEAGPAAPAGLNPFAAANPGAGVGAANEAEAGLGPKLNRFHGFRLVGDRLICLKGDSSILAIDGELGQVEWSYSVSGMALNPLIGVSPRRIVAQTVGDKLGLLVLETETGRKVMSTERSEKAAWQRAPVSIDDDHVILVVDALTVVSFDVATASDSWSFRESDSLPKYGHPRAFVDGDRLLVLHDGVTLVRIDSKNGRLIWRALLGSEDLSRRPEALAIDGTKVYCATVNEGGEILKAINLDKGLLAWERPLSGPTRGWSLTVTETSILAYPSTLSEMDPAEGLPVALVRRSDGGLVQRFLFPAGSPPLETILTPRGVMVATDQGLWALGERRAIDVGPISR